MLVTASGVITGLVSAAAFLPYGAAFKVSSISFQLVMPILLLVGLMAMFLLILTKAAKMWSPKMVMAPGSQDVEAMYEKYISQGPDMAFNKALIDLVHSVELAQKVNNQKIDGLNWLVRLLQAQVLLLIVTVLWAPIAQIH
jgi:hypothetical protein